MNTRNRYSLNWFPGRQSIDCPKIRRIQAYIDEHFTRDLKLAGLGMRFGLHPDYLCRKFKKKTGTAFHEYVLHIRIQKAIDLLVRSEKGIKEISYDVGFKRPEVFSRAFKRVVGCSPKNYRNQLPDLEFQVQREGSFLENEYGSDQKSAGESSFV